MRNTRRESKNIAASRIFNLRNRIRQIDRTRIARMLEMIEYLGRVHGKILVSIKKVRMQNEKINTLCLCMLVLHSYFCILCNTNGMDYTPRRVVSLQPSATVILRALGRLSVLAGCTKYCLDVCPELAVGGVTIVPDSWTAQAAQIADLKPDLVIASVPYQEKAIAEIMKSGARFLGLAPRSLADIYFDIAAIAGIMNGRDEGLRIIQKMQTEIDFVRSHTRNLSKPKVFCEEWGKPLIASQAWVAELVEAAGGEFIGTPGAQISCSEVPALSPDVIITAWCGAGDRVPLEKIIRTRLWEDIPAARNRRIYCIRDEYLNTPAPTLIRGLHALAAAIHPERFPQCEGLRCIDDIG
jgi:iron complex transport system substrate-binding protein